MTTGGNMYAKNRPAKKRFLASPTFTAILIAVVAYIGLVANEEVAASLAEGKRLDLSESTAGPWQYIREGVSLLIAAYLLFGVARHKSATLKSVTVSVWVAMFCLYVFVQVMRVFFDPLLPDSYALLGLRFVYLASIIASIAWFNSEERGILLRRLCVLLIPLLLTETWIAANQVLNGAAVLGSTFLGARPWGTYSSSNNLGLAALGIVLVLAVSPLKGRWFWMVIAAGLAVSTGSRNAILGVALVMLGLLVAKWKFRLFFMPMAAMALFGVYTIASSSSVSGREIDGEVRFDVWAGALSYIDGLWEFLMGKGLGTSSNAVTVLMGKDALYGPAIADSTVVMVMLSIGVTGLAWFLGALVVGIKRTQFERRFVVFPAVVLCSLAFNSPEVSPFNILAAVAIGACLNLKGDEAPAIEDPKKPAKKLDVPAVYRNSTAFRSRIAELEKH